MKENSLGILDKGNKEINFLQRNVAKYKKNTKNLLRICSLFLRYVL